MNSVRHFIESATDEIRGLNRIKPGFKATVGNSEVMVRAILDRTAVVHPLGSDHPNNRILVKLEALLVEEVEWEPKSENEQRIWRSTLIGKKNSLIEKDLKRE